MNLAEATKIANRAQSWLTPYCERIQIAGSIRRKKPDVGDIELVAIPKTLPIVDLFGEAVPGKIRSRLNDRSLFIDLGIIHKFGERFVQVELLDGISLDLFIVLHPAQWGVIFPIRTGPADFSKWLVTPRSKGGALHNGWRCEDGRVWDGQTTLNFPEELDLFKWLEIEWALDPAHRKPAWNRFGRTYRD